MKKSTRMVKTRPVKDSKRDLSPGVGCRGTYLMNALLKEFLFYIVSVDSRDENTSFYKMGYPFPIRWDWCYENIRIPSPQGSCALNK